MEVTILGSKMTRVFISYSSKDISFAERIANDLEKAEIPIWFAPRSIAPGARDVQAIGEGLSTASHIVVVLSPESVSSRAVKDEVEAAIKRSWEDDDIQLIFAEYIPTQLPTLWKLHQRIPNFAGNYPIALQSLIEHIGIPSSNALLETEPVIGAEEFDDLLVQAIKTFLAAQSPATKRAYSSRLKAFMTWREENLDSCSLTEILQTYLSYLQQQSLSVSTVQMTVNTIKGMYRTLAYLDRRFANDVLQAQRIDTPKTPRSIRTLLNIEQAQNLLTVPGTRSLKGLRNTCILALMMVTGLRRSEIVNLTWGQLGEINGHAVITGLLKSRTVKVPRWVANHLYAWADRNGLDIELSEDYVFHPITKDERTLKKRGLTPHSIYKLVKYYLHVAQLPAVNPDDLRHMAGSLALTGGATETQVRLLMGLSFRYDSLQNYVDTNLNLENHAVDYNPLRDPHREVKSNIVS
jgi:integrase/recombinase XerD